MNYYNEWDPKAAAWLRELIHAGELPKGYVDERSITEVTPADLDGFTQCHFFSGIGGWSYALRLAGIPDTVRLWTGSPPCQPFSVAGKHRGQKDSRHLAPTFLALIRQCQPELLFGEQVAAAIGKRWLDDLYDELETEGYACGSAVLPACSVGAPHKRERLFFGAIRGLSDPDGEPEYRTTECSLDGKARGTTAGIGARVLFSGQPGRDGLVIHGELGDTDGKRLERQQPEGHTERREKSSVRQTGLCGGARAGVGTYSGNEFWRSVDWIGCKDGKFRPIEPGIEPLVNGVPGRLGRLRGYGNAIVPQVAATFITAFIEGIFDEH